MDQRVKVPGVPAEVKAFAVGLKRDCDVVKAAFRLEWSNGQVEGQVNRLKLIKRQMYGRAGFALLRHPPVCPPGVPRYHGWRRRTAYGSDIILDERAEDRLRQERSVA